MYNYYRMYLSFIDLHSQSIYTIHSYFFLSFFYYFCSFFIFLHHHHHLWPSLSQSVSILFDIYNVDTHTPSLKIVQMCSWFIIWVEIDFSFCFRKKKEKVFCFVLHFHWITWNCIKFSSSLPIQCDKMSIDNIGQNFLSMMFDVMNMWMLRKEE